MRSGQYYVQVILALLSLLLKQDFALTFCLTLIRADKWQSCIFLHSERLLFLFWFGVGLHVMFEDLNPQVAKHLLIYRFRRLRGKYGRNYKLRASSFQMQIFLSNLTPPFLI